MRILTIDDHGLFREGLELMLSRISPDAQISHAATLNEAATITSSNPKFDLILTDLGLPGAKGIDALIRVRELSPTTPTIVLAASENASLVKNAIENGAAGYIFKSLDSNELSRALSKVLGGGVYLPPVAMSMQLVQEVEETALTGLTKRKKQVLRALIRGLSNKEIARELHISDETVKSHAHEIYKILGVHNRTQAVFALAQNGTQLD